MNEKRDFALRRRLVGLQVLEQESRPDLLPAQLTGECFSPTLGKRIGLGFVAPHVEIGSLVRTGDRTARVAALPFYDPERRRPASFRSSKLSPSAAIVDESSSPL